MAKQTFTTGQVLTAAQMTSLQQTAMGGGSATTNTVSFVLVAADAGTTVTMTSASATTITVNTSLFAAGDTVYIQNLGAGTSTITAGTATVNTSASLALAQYEGGQLYFTSTSASIFVKGAAPVSINSGKTIVNTSETTTSATYTGLTTPQAVTLTTGTKVMVIVSCRSFGNNNNLALASYAISGATTTAANDAYAVVNGGDLSGFGTYNTMQMSYVSFATVTAGSNTFTMQFRTVAAMTGTFLNRQIIVVDLGS